MREADAKASRIACFRPGCMIRRCLPKLRSQHIKGQKKHRIVGVDPCSELARFDDADGAGDAGAAGARGPAELLDPSMGVTGGGVRGALRCRLERDEGIKVTLPVPAPWAAGDAVGGAVRRTRRTVRCGGESSSSDDDLSGTKIDSSSLSRGAAVVGAGVTWVALLSWESWTRRDRLGLTTVHPMSSSSSCDMGSCERAEEATEDDEAPCAAEDARERVVGPSPATSEEKPGPSRRARRRAAIKGQRGCRSAPGPSQEEDSAPSGALPPPRFEPGGDREGDLFLSSS